MDLFEPLSTIPEETVYQDSNVQLKYLNDEDSASGEFTSGALKKAQDDPLLQHWISLCHENIQLKRNLERELLEYRESMGVRSKELLEQNLFELHEKLCELEGTYEQMETDLIATDPWGKLSVNELRERVQEKKNNRSQKGGQTDNEPVGHKTSMYNQIQRNQNTSKANEEYLNDKISEKLDFKQIQIDRNKSQPARGLSKEMKERIVKDKINGRISEYTRSKGKGGTEIIVKDQVPHFPPPRPRGAHDLTTKLAYCENATGNGVELPKLPKRSQSNCITSCSSQRIKTACTLPEIQTTRAQIRNDQKFFSVSDSTQTDLPSMQRHRHSICEKNASVIQTSHNILPPLMKTPKTQQDIRNFFQAPKQKKKQALNHSHAYDILIIQHNEIDESDNYTSNIQEIPKCPPLPKIPTDHRPFQNKTLCTKKTLNSPKRHRKQTGRLRIPQSVSGWESKNICMT